MLKGKPTATSIQSMLLSPPVTSLSVKHCQEVSLGILLQSAIYLFIKMIPVLIIQACLPAGSRLKLVWALWNVICEIAGITLSNYLLFFDVPQENKISLK